MRNCCDLGCSFHRKLPSQFWQGQSWLRHGFLHVCTSYPVFCSPNYPPQGWRLQMRWWIHPTCPLHHPSCPFFQTIPIHRGDMGADCRGSLLFPHPRGQCQVCCVVLYHLLHCFVIDPPHFHLSTIYCG